MTAQNPDVHVINVNDAFLVVVPRSNKEKRQANAEVLVGCVSLTRTHLAQQNNHRLRPRLLLVLLALPRLRHPHPRLLPWVSVLWLPLVRVRVFST